jgi:hypothetical protein
VRWKEARAALAKRTPGQGPKNISTDKSPAPKAKQAEPSEEQMVLGEGWSHVVRGGRVVKAATPSPTPKPIPSQVTKALKPIVTISKTAKTKKSTPKTPSAPKAAPVKSTALKAVAAQPPTVKPVVTPNPINSPLEEISDLLDKLPIEACVELTRRLLTSISSLPTGVARQRAALKTVFLFVAEYGSTP